jgi:hypothetical protein
MPLIAQEMGLDLYLQDPLNFFFFFHFSGASGAYSELKKPREVFTGTRDA